MRDKVGLEEKTQDFETVDPGTSGVLCREGSQSVNDLSLLRKYSSGKFTSGWGSGRR